MSKFRLVITLEVEVDDVKAFLTDSGEFAREIAATANEDGEKILSASPAVTDESGKVLFQQSVAGAR